MKVKLKDIDLSFMKSIPKEMAVKMKIISLKEEDGIIYFYTNENTYEKSSYLSLMFNKEIKLIEGNEEEVITLITSCYGENENNNIEDNVVENLFSNVIRQAIEKRTSDIHIEPQKQWCNIRFRIDGVLRLINKIHTREYSILINKIKLDGSMDIGDKLRPQDGKLSFKCNEIFYDLRISTIPTVYGEKVVIRILYKNEKLLDINNLNFNSKQREKINKLLALKHGMVLVNGPTGSGKSTTLYALLNACNKEDINISTIEDPTEFHFDGINQINVNEKVGLNFSTGLKYILRQDPDVILIGEVRDEETAKMAVRAAITGHKVYSTIHTNSGKEVYGRLIDMGAEEYLVKSALKGIITQRLVRVLCVNCKCSYNITLEESKRYDIPQESKIYDAVGCEACEYTGYKSRTMVSEVIIPTNNFFNKDNASSYKSEMLENGKRLLEKGIISLQEYILLKEGEGLND